MIFGIFGSIWGRAYGFIWGDGEDRAVGHVARQHPADVVSASSHAATSHPPDDTHQSGHTATSHPADDTNQSGHTRRT